MVIRQNRMPDPRRLFAGVMGMAQADVTSSCEMRTLAAWDSLRHIDLVLAIEGAYAIKLDLREIIALTSYGKLVEILAARGLNTESSIDTS